MIVEAIGIGAILAASESDRRRALAQGLSTGDTVHQLTFEGKPWSDEPLDWQTREHQAALADIALAMRGLKNTTIYATDRRQEDRRPEVAAEIHLRVGYPGNPGVISADIQYHSTVDPVRSEELPVDIPSHEAETEFNELVSSFIDKHPHIDFTEEGFALMLTMNPMWNSAEFGFQPAALIRRLQIVLNRYLPTVREREAELRAYIDAIVEVYVDTGQFPQKRR